MNDPDSELEPRWDVGKVSTVLLVLSVAVIAGFWIYDRENNHRPAVIIDNYPVRRESTVPAPATIPKPPPERVEALPTVSIHAYDLLKNPFIRQPSVLLDVESYPLLVNGQVWQYTEPNNTMLALGFKGLHFKRMVSPEIGIYGVMAFQADAGSREQQEIGELAVFVDSGAELEMHELWIVQPEGTLKGTNGLGAAIEIPMVKFVRYANSAPAPNGAGDD